MPKYKTAKCKSCGAPIIWVEMVSSGRKMPVDAKPKKMFHLYGNAPLSSVVDVYESHFATCPNADDHRRAKGKK